MTWTLLVCPECGYSEVDQGSGGPSDDWCGHSRERFNAVPVEAECRTVDRLSWRAEERGYTHPPHSPERGFWFAVQRAIGELGEPSRTGLKRQRPRRSEAAAPPAGHSRETGPD